MDIVEKFLRENVKEFIELMNQNGKEVETHLEFELVSFELVGLKLKIEILEKNTQVLIYFEEGNQPQLRFKKV